MGMGFIFWFGKIRVLAFGLVSLLFSLNVWAETDTLTSSNNDKVILTYTIKTDGLTTTVDMLRSPRIIPSSVLRKSCKEELDRLKVVAFERIGSFGKVHWNWKGISSPKSVKLPNGISMDRSEEGYFIFGESLPMTFNGDFSGDKAISIPVYIALYEKKHNYKILIECNQPLLLKPKSHSTRQRVSSQQVQKTVTERIAVPSVEYIEGDNTDVTNILSTISLVREMLATETELPFSVSLQSEINNLISIKSKIRDPQLIEKINEVILQFNVREKELKDAQNATNSASAAEQKALMEQQKQEEEKLRKEAEETARMQEEKQQKRTIWMIIGGVILGVVGFVGNGIFKHFRDVKNQKNIMQMQESLVRQAEGEAKRRSREIVRNKAHQAVGTGKKKLRTAMQTQTPIQKKNPKRRSI